MDETVTTMTIRRYRRFNRWLVGACLSIIVMVVMLNLVVDPYNVFGVSHLKNGYTDNERFNKIDRILERPTEHDAFIVGSSRMGVYDPSEIDRVRPGRYYYNLAVFGGHARDAHMMLKALVDNGVKIREVVMGIDIFPFLEREDEITPAYRHHPRVTGKSYVDFYKSYLFVPSIMHAMLKLQQNRMSIPDIVFDFENTGRFYLASWDHRIAEDHERFMKETFEISLSEPMRRKVIWNIDRFDQLGDFARWLEDERISGYFFIQPHHASELDNYTGETLRVFRQRIRRILGDVPDYSDHGDWSTNNAWYYEPRHYRPTLAAQVVKQLFTSRERYFFHER